MKFPIAIDPATADTALGRGGARPAGLLARWVRAVVDASVERCFGPAEKIHITVPARVLVRIDACARRHGESRSGFLVRAAQQAMRGG